MSRCSATSLAGDHVGADSCIDLRTSEEFDLYVRECEMRYKRRREESRGLESVGKSKEPKELPPPLPRLPWIMKRYGTSDGRLIIRKEKVGHCEYLRAHRSNGRLMLHLVSLDYDDCYGQESDVDEEDEEESCSVVADAESSSENVDGGVFSGERGSSSGCGGNKCLLCPTAALTGACLTCK